MNDKDKIFSMSDQNFYLGNTGVTRKIKDDWVSDNGQTTKGNFMNYLTTQT